MEETESVLYQHPSFLNLPTPRTDAHFSHLPSGVTSVDENSVDDPHAFSCLLKLFLRELPEPLVPFNNYEGLVEAGSELCLCASARSMCMYIYIWGTVSDKNVVLLYIIKVFPP